MLGEERRTHVPRPKPSRRSKLEFLHLKCIRRTKGTARQRKRSLMEENARGKMKKVDVGNIDDCDRNKRFLRDPDSHRTTPL